MNEVETPEIWTPSGSTQGVTSAVGRNVETGGMVVSHTFHFKDAKTGRECTVKVPADQGVDHNLVMEAAATAYEKWLLEVRAKGTPRPPTRAERLEVGAALRAFREHARKRRESTTGKLYFASAK